MQENYELMKELISNIVVFFKSSEDLKTEMIEQLIRGCPQRICLTVEEFSIQEEIKHYLSQLKELSIDDMNTVYKNYSFFQIMEFSLGDKLGLLSDETYNWIIEIDSALGSLRSIPPCSDILQDTLDEKFKFPDENDLSG